MVGRSKTETVRTPGLPGGIYHNLTIRYIITEKVVEQITGLKCNQVDLNQGIVRLEVGSTKNDEGRTVYFNQELR